MIRLATLPDILDEMIGKNSSDANVTEGSNVVFRISGRLVDGGMEATRESSLLILEELTGGKGSYVTLNQPKELDGSYPYYSAEKGKTFYFRYNAALSDSRIHITIRKIIDSVPLPEDIGLVGDDDGRFIAKMMDDEPGILIVSGATGSGKSTTLACLLDKALREKSIKLITLEEPIEYRFSGEYPESIAIQREVGRDTKSFYDGLVAAMRQNPDYIFVGEIRDGATAEAAMNAALTGHKVCATVHAEDPSKTIDRIRYLLDGKTNDFGFVKAIMHQRLSHGPDGTVAIRNYKFDDF